MDSDYGVPRELSEVQQNQTLYQPDLPPCLQASENRKRKSVSLGLRSPMQLTSSPGVNFLVKSAAVKKEALKRANMVGSPKTPKPPSYPQLASPSLDDLSPDTRVTNSQASKRKRRKLISDIWKEADPIYKDGKLVEGFDMSTRLV